MKIERMDSFFSARLNGYDEHMINNVDGCKDGYVKLAELIPNDINKLLDLGCGTGLELERIFENNPDVHVTGIDLTQEMLDRLQEKYSDKNIELICSSYLGYDFGIETYDVAISFETMHHLTYDEKIRLYSGILRSLKPGGKYIECDYMVIDQGEEDFYFSEYERIKKEQNLRDGEFYHYDTPCTIENQIKLFKHSGFSTVRNLWRMGNTTIIEALK